MKESSILIAIVMSSLYVTVESREFLYQRKSCRPYPPCTVCKRSYLRHPNNWNLFGICYMGKFFGYNRCPNRTIFSKVWNVCVHPPKMDPKKRDNGILNKAICGISIQSLIVGGHESSIEDWPWQVSLMVGRYHVCGGTLINQQWIITAAHCVYKKKANKLKIVLGATVLYKVQTGKVSRSVAKIIINSKYTNGGSYPNDIALLKLSSPVDESEYVRPVCLPSSREEFTPTDTCWITGWGETLDASTKSVLNELKIDLTSLAECKKNWTIYANPNHICVGDGRIGPCRGDSGGPLVCLKKDRIILAGVSSFSNELCRIHGFPAIYTAVSGFMNWIYYTLRTN